MAEPKTKLNDFPVADFINAIPDARIRQDSWTIVEIMQATAQASPHMWGSAIIGFGQVPVIDARGKVNFWPLIGFSPRKHALTLYLKLGGLEHAADLFARLGKHTLGKGCLYIKRLSDVDLTVLEELVGQAVETTRSSPAQDGW